MSHIDKPSVLYEGPELNVKDFVCGGCIMGIAETSECTILKPSEIDLKVGACGLWVGGENVEEVEGHPPMEIVPAGVVGYTEDGPFTCGRCSNFRPLAGGRADGRCLVVNGMVHRRGCCNAWVKKVPR